MPKISIEVGHGGTDPGAMTKDGKICEKDVALDISLELKRQLERLNFQVLISRETDKNDKLADFIPKIKAFAPDLHLSIHLNSFDHTASGFDLFYREDGITARHKSQSVDTALFIRDEIVKIGLPIHGIVPKQAEFKALYGDYPAVYCECLFIDNPFDYAKIDTLAERKSVGLAIAKAVVKSLGATWVNEKTAETSEKSPIAANTPAISKTVYRVVAGSYSDKLNAENHALELQKQGIECFLAAYQVG